MKHKLITCLYCSSAIQVISHNDVLNYECQYCGRSIGTDEKDGIESNYEWNDSIVSEENNLPQLW